MRKLSWGWLHWTTMLALVLAMGVKSMGEKSEVQSPPADLVLNNGHLITLDPARPQAQALAARDGRIVAVGSNQDVLPLIGPQTQVLDLEGQFGIPGFIEGHGHFLGLGDARLQLDLRTAKTWDEIVAMVRAAVAQSPPGTWIRGRGWHQDKWEQVPEPNLEGFPLHAALSAVSPQHPVLLTHASGHAVFVNAKAMELAGIDPTTRNPPGGEILHGPDGAPTGLLREEAEGLIDAVRTQAAREETRKMVELASAECLTKGVTSFHDAGSSLTAIAALQQAADAGWLGVRLWVMIRDSNERLAAHFAREKDHGKIRDPQGMLAVGGIKLSLDGALGSRGAWLLAPYSDSPESTGLNLIPLATARETAELAITHGYQLCIHAIGDRANREVLDLYQETFTRHPDRRDLRWRIEHAQHLHPDDIPRFAALGVIASVQAIHCTSDGPWVPDRLGAERSAQGAYVWRRLLDSGAALINGTDVPVEDIDPIANFHASISRQMSSGEAFYPAQRMTRQEALESMTRKPAWAAFEEDLKGSLSLGKFADVTILSQDIMTIPEALIPQTRVMATVLGGKVVYRAK